MNNPQSLPVAQPHEFRAAALQKLSRSPLPRVLFVSHNLGGGTEKHIFDLARLLQGHCEILLLKPYDEQVLSLSWLNDRENPGETFNAWFSGSGDYPDLLAPLRDLAVTRVHVHHIDCLPSEILNLAGALGVPLDITLHDHFPMSSQYHLGEGGVLPASHGEHRWGWDAATWHTRMHAFLRGAARVICPSRYLQEQVRAAFPDIVTLLWPHPETPSAAHIERVKVLILGRSSLTKGLNVIEACARDAVARNLPLSFHIIGPIDHVIEDMSGLPISVHGSYRDDQLEDLIANERADAFLFPAQIPESYCYTLSAALATPLPIVASRLGAFIERLGSRANARMPAWNSPASVWNDTLLALADAHRDTKVSAAGTQGWDEYRQRYLAAIKNQPPTTTSLHLKPLFLTAPKRLGKAAERTLPELFDAGVECGQEESRRELKRRVGVADSEIAAARQSAEAAHAVLLLRDRDVERQDRQLQEAHQRYLVLEAEMANVRQTAEDLQLALEDTRERLEAERDAARQAYDAIEQSTSWRLTGPLRSAIQTLHNLRHRANDLHLGTRRIPQQVNMARQILREEGPLALGKRVQEKLTRRAETPVPAVNYQLEPAMAPLAMATVEQPVFSIIIPVYEQHLLTYTCLKSVAATCAGKSLEVIVIDDASPTAASEALSCVTGVRFVRNEKNLGFLRNCNKAAALARGEYIVLLNNDTIATGDWLGQMAKVFETQARVGMVGAKLIYPDGVLQEAGGIVWRDGSAWNYGRDDDAAKPEYNYLREVDYCSGACIMLPRPLWNELGGFDEGYAPAYYEEVDLCFRLRAAGKRVIYQPAAVIVHFEGRSSGTDLTQGVKRHQVINQETLATRWRTVLAAHRLNGMMPHLEKDRYVQRRVLVIDACMLTPDQDAGSMRMFEMLGIMQQMGCKVTFIADNLEFREPYVSQIRQCGVEVLHHPYVVSMSQYLARSAADFDVIIVSRATVAVKYMEAIKQAAPRAKLVFDTVDLHFLRMERQAELDPSAQNQSAAAAMRAQELDIMAKSDLTLVVSPFEQELLDKLAPASRVGIVSLIHETMPGKKSFAERSGILFIGGFRHPPNLDAVTWYVENVLPLIRQKAPGLITTLIGSNAPPALQNYAADDFIIAGFVPDVTDYYGNARLSISPLRYGAGVKGKVNISMQYGVPVVATSVSVEGMYLKNGENVMVADDPAEFADAVIRAHGDAELWSRLSQGGLDNIEAHFSRQCARRALTGVLELAG